jgi:hypothetical protein
VILLILPLIWAAVLLPPWVIHRRERRVSQHVAERQRRSLVRYIFGSYEPYREVSPRLPSEVEDHDRSYAPIDGSDELYEDEYDDVYDEFYGYLPVDDAALDPQAGDPAYEGGYTPDDGYGADRDDAVRESVAAMRSEPFIPRVRADVPADRVEADRSRTGPGGDAGMTPVRRFPTPVTSADQSAAPAARRGDRSGSRAALHRRRRIFLALFAAMLGTLAGVLFLRSPEAWAAHGVAVVLLASYIVLLVVHHQRIQEQTHKVRELEISRGRTARSQQAAVGHGAEVAR